MQAADGRLPARILLGRDFLMRIELHVVDDFLDTLDLGPLLVGHLAPRVQTLEAVLLGQTGPLWTGGAFLKRVNSPLRP